MNFRLNFQERATSVFLARFFKGHGLIDGLISFAIQLLHISLGLDYLRQRPGSPVLTQRFSVLHPCLPCLK